MAVLRLDADLYRQYRTGLAELLCATVATGGAVGFLHPLSPEAALAFWDGHARGLTGDTLGLFVDIDGDTVAGTVSLACDLPTNQPHRGDICKMMVHPRHRRRGIGRRLIAAGLSEATRRGLSLLVLDTRTNDAAQSLYAEAGFVVAGEIPGYALDTDGKATHGTTLMYRTL